ncbi:winged helix DNA-binding domain-containing protein [Isoptericola hypogeus]|uniref:Winged helix DNA-binding domain-containing protein n=1 Tax=Isoptericola hypogeus TaxID=300179 RepID=A0ABN2JBQ8_9MICO
MTARPGGQASRAAPDSRIVRAARLEATHLRGRGRPDLPAVVEHLLAVQAQELQPALWGLSRRVVPASRPGHAAANRALADGELLRTHVLRPTWHVLRPTDARWLLELTAPRIARLMASTEKAWGLGDQTRGADAVAAEVANGPRTRAELKEALVARGLLAADAPGIAFTQMLMHAELRRLVISGPPPADRPTHHQVYATFDDRVPSGYGPLGSTYDAEAAVVELWRRYLPGRAFATVNDLRLWSDVTVADLRRGLAVLRDAGEVVEIPGGGDLEGLTLVATAATAERWLDGAGPAHGDAAGDGDGGPTVDLLQAYDELFMSYRETRHVLLDPALPAPERAGAFVHGVVVDGVFAGRWRWPSGAAPSMRRPEPVDGSRGPQRGRLAVDVQWVREASDAERAALDRQVAELEAYLAG